VIELATPMRGRVERLESILEDAPQAECPIRNHFAPGVYAREMTVPAGVIATGAVHKTEHLSILSAGHCWLTTEDGVQELRAPYTCVSKPGAKRAIYAVTECVFTTIHPTTETDIEKLCEQLTESTAAELIGGPKNRQLLAQKASQELEG
jgi:hypothetical protein